MRFIRHVIASVGLAAALLPATAAYTEAGEITAPVIVELFTSQGCSSCPPADAYLAELAGRGDVIALSLHVDYWDYLGWRDTFAQRAFTERQYEYRDAWSARVVYTPQLVVQGRRIDPGSQIRQVEDALSRIPRPETGIAVLESDGGLRADLNPGIVAAGQVWIARYRQEETVKINRGENAGEAITYHNIVTEIMPYGTWDGTSVRSIDLPIPTQGEGVVIWVQAPGNGPILNAAGYEPDA
ncbi:MAG: DUF1223 domain-containing protein [Pseudomonadota bacterium]